MIVVEKLEKSFMSQDVLKDVTFTLERGEICHLLGPSGAGKSTLLEIIAGSIKPDRGRCELKSTRIGYAFQDDSLIPWQSVAVNLEFALAGYFSSAEISKRSLHWLERFGLGSAREKKPSEVSGGMRKRLNIARALAIEPEILLLDEPFAFQDSHFRDVLLEEIKTSQQELASTIILAGHEPALTGLLQGRVVKLRGGLYKTPR